MRASGVSFEAGLVVSSSLASLASVEGAAAGMSERAEGRPVEDVFEAPVATGGLAQNGRAA